MLVSRGMEDDLRVITRKNHFQTRSITHIGHQDLKIEAASNRGSGGGRRRLPSFDRAQDRPFDFPFGAQDRHSAEFILSFVEGLRSQ